MRAAPAAAIVAILVALLTWFSVHAFNREAEMFDQAFTELNRFEMIENALYRHVFTARAGMLRNYDPLVEDINNLRESLRRLREMSAADTDALAACDRIATVVERQEELVERFKTDNALLHNSLSFFGRFGVHPPTPELDSTISAAAAAILHLALDTSIRSRLALQPRSARAMAWRRSRILNGLLRYADAPAWMPATWSAGESRAVKKITGMVRSSGSALMARATA